MEGHLVPHYHSIRIKGVIIGEDVSILVDNGATQSFINHGFIVRKSLQTNMLKVFYVSNINGYYTLCDYSVRLNIRMGKYDLDDEFYVFSQDSMQVITFGV